MFHLKKQTEKEETPQKINNNKKNNLLELTAVSLAVLLMFVFGFGSAQAIKSIGGIETSLIGESNNPGGNSAIVDPLDIPSSDEETSTVKTTDESLPLSEPSTAAPGIDPTNYSKEEIIAYFNNAANRVRSERPGFEYLEKSPVSNTYFAGMENKIIDAIVNSFFKNISASVKKGQASAPTGDEVTLSYFGSEQTSWASKLTASDITKASVTRSGNNYIVNLRIKSEINPEMNGRSAHARGLLIITRQGIIDLAGPKGLAIPSQADLTLNFHDGYISATIDSQGRIKYMQSGFIVDGVGNNVTLSKIVETPSVVKMTITKTYTQSNFVW